MTEKLEIRKELIERLKNEVQQLDKEVAELIEENRGLNTIIARG